MNIFLTGNVQVGKSTIIQKYLETFTGSLCGFSTKKLSHQGKDKIYIFDINDRDKSPQKSNLVALCGDNKIACKYDEPFETIGVKSLSELDCDLIIMDELGIIEKDSRLFQQHVISALDSNIPVIGVIKPKHNEFLDIIRNRSDVIILDVDHENRDSVIHEFIPLVNKNMGI